MTRWPLRLETQTIRKDESRLITVGYSVRGRLLVVSHVEGGGATHLISVRRATLRERKRHEDEAPGEGG